jgi:hypothetical protein
LLNRRPGQFPEVWNVTPSHPQYGRRSLVHMRFVGMHVPGVLASQPSPSHTPEAHSVAARHWPPSGTRPAALPVAGSVVGAGGGEGSCVGAGCFGADEHADAISAMASMGKRIRGGYHRARTAMLTRHHGRSSTLPPGVIVLGDADDVLEVVHVAVLRA